MKFIIEWVMIVVVVVLVGSSFEKLPNLERKEILRENLKNFEDFNSSGRSYKIGRSQFSDKTLEELAEKYLDMNMSSKIGLKFLNSGSNNDPYDYYPIDWREEDIFLPARDQGECGACWAFASVGTVEALRAKEFSIKKYLSPQQLIDCDSKDKGCKGGWPSIAYNYVANKGLVTEENYPYKAENDECKSEVVENESEVKIDGRFARCEEDECMQNDFQYNLLKNGPVTVVIDAYNTNFFNYKSGIYDESCAEPNHAIMLVGYGEDQSTGTKYWIIRNSWGSSWGMNGYGYIKFDLNNYYSCNINRYGFQPKIIE